MLKSRKKKVSKDSSKTQIINKKPAIVPKVKSREKILDSYDYDAGDIPIHVKISMKKGEFVPIYEVNISKLSTTTEFILEKIRQELIKKSKLEMIDLTTVKKKDVVEERFKETIAVLIRKYFPDEDEKTKGFLTSYLVEKSLGLGSIEILNADVNLEEIVINGVDEPIWVYHKNFGWVKTNVNILNEDQTRHYASIVARRVGRQITVLQPLLDAHLAEGDRVNATIMPISTAGNTFTIRKFSRDPWTITRFLKAGSISFAAAALIWMAIQYEMSILIAGGTASGKTSMLNVLTNFFPPNQRIISIEDTREITLPKFLHWVPMTTRLPNPEGRGEITMGDLLVNSLRMRPDRIIVGEVRRKRESETLFEAIHTGHSVYATIHANTADETIKRLTNPPIDVPEILVPAISLIIVQFRNRRTGTRRTFQVAEVLADAKVNVLMQYNAKQDKLVKLFPSMNLYKNLSLYTGYSVKEIDSHIKDKEQILRYLVNQNIENVDAVGRIMAEYYTDRENLMEYVKNNKPFDF